jgi:FXSXX-COOH protein
MQSPDPDDLPAISPAQMEELGGSVFGRALRDLLDRHEDEEVYAGFDNSVFARFDNSTAPTDRTSS